MTLPSYEEFEARRRAEGAKWEGQCKLLMQKREQLVEAHQQQTHERLSQLDAFSELLRLDSGARSNGEGAARPGASNVQAAIDELTQLTQELARLRWVEAYLGILLFLQQSMMRIRTHLTEGSLEEALFEYLRLRHSSEYLRQSMFCSPSGPPSLPSHLREYRGQCQRWAKNAIDQVLATMWSQQLAALGWPKTLAGDATQLEALLRTFDVYLQFCEGTIDTDEGISGTGPSSDPAPPRSQLYARPVQVMLMPIRMRFKFHYATDRPTGRSDRPEWYLSHLLQVATTHAPLIGKLFTVEDLVEGDQRGDPSVFLGAFLDGLLGLARDQLIIHKEAIQADPFILMHTVREVFVFIRQLNESLLTDYTPETLLADSLWASPADVARWMGTQGEAALDALKLTLSPDNRSAEDGGSGPGSPRTGRRSNVFSASVSPGSTALAGSIAIDLTSPMDVVANDMIGLLRELNDTLLRCLPPRMQLDYLHKVIGPVLEAIHEQIDFEMPPFHHTSGDVQTLLGHANLLSALRAYLGDDAGESPEALELAASEIYQSYLEDEDARGMSGSIYHRSVASFQALLDRCLGSLHEHLWESFASPANAFARSMHYGVVRSRVSGERHGLPADTISSPPSPLPSIGMHDELRRAMVSLATAYENIVPALREEPADTLQSMLLHSLVTWTMDRWLLSNYYRVEIEEGAEEGTKKTNMTRAPEGGTAYDGEDGALVREDRRCLDQLVSDYAIFYQFVRNLLSLPDQLVDAAMVRCTETVRLLTLPTLERVRLTRHITGDDKGNAYGQDGKNDDDDDDDDDDMSAVVRLLQKWHITSLSIADCERILSMIRS